MEIGFVLNEQDGPLRTGLGGRKEKGENKAMNEMMSVSEFVSGDYASSLI